MDGDEQSPDHQPTIPIPWDRVNCSWNRTGSIGPHFGGARMFLSLIVSEPDNARYLERTAERLRAMSAHTTGLEGADPAEVRTRLKARDRHARRQAAANQSVA